MHDTRTMIACAAALFTTAVAIVVLRRLAAPLGLLDRPDARKQHVGSVPLVGGLAVFCGVVVGAWWYGDATPFNRILLTTTAALTIMGALDDRQGLSVRARLLIQTAAILIVIGSTDVYIRTLGIINGVQIQLGPIGIPLTLIAVIGLLNAFNMMDGIDGLAGSMGLVSIGTIFMFHHQDISPGVTILIAMLAAGMLPYLAANLGFFGRKIFMGDAGSMALGYLLGWTLIQLSQSGSSDLQPVDVLWCVALPALDTLAVMYRRMRNRQSPFKPDRGHVHHMLLQLGLSPRVTLLVLVIVAICLAFIGNIVHQYGQGVSLAMFCSVLVTYILFATRRWPIITGQAVQQRGQ
ncbi:UDP-GlcNAc:undecaprenyl-phosphate GlcNAc-1-phosphate transferase [Dyella sp. OK004]|uniref:undecaprenyl/decaprenyl-phosphate alpha-N-acetylglucosaminyl 1-phosphate transferase n=1 Tax=Dyella sp. OK004 TaxID=1855292 RepID=UPI0008E718D3|nr:undecaprenyl/decaprenyl-phosphate alpha-N-acetylglucosaminyl 1-phosphate transferase [Dyella sp. OK004]SFS08163.1 UDP-GlcNAc:undecaprenyl-phosphate GlcNAc-1-phosphate transferase [Dyella sp. OK004]